jgi:hypothetical protein
MHAYMFLCEDLSNLILLFTNVIWFEVDVGQIIGLYALL